VSAIEAQAAGCVVVGGRRIGLRETVLDGVTGTLISSENQLAPAVIRLLNDPEAMRRMGQKGKEWVHRQFPTSKADAEWIRLFKEVLAEMPVTTIPFSIRRATPKDYARAMVRFYKQKLS
jgi:glycosyltransferase involved in cell wall biosynthesis